MREEQDGHSLAPVLGDSLPGQDEQAGARAVATAVPSGAVGEAVCPNCNTSGTQRYCPRCGQKRPDVHDYSLGHILHDAFHELFHVDGKIARTVLTIIQAPGMITEEYWEGRRARFLTPLRIYLLSTAAYFAFVRLALPTDPGAPSSESFKQLLANVSIPQFEGQFRLFYKSFMVFSIGWLALLFRFTMGGQRPYGAYLIAALHTVSVLFVMMAVAQKLEEWVLPFWPALLGALQFLTLGLLYWPYVAVSMKRWSGKSWGWVVVRMALFLVSTVVIDGLVYLLAVLAAIFTSGRVAS